MPELFLHKLISWIPLFEIMKFIRVIKNKENRENYYYFLKQTNKFVKDFCRRENGSKKLLKLDFWWLKTSRKEKKKEMT